jgi:hypothetical protein
MKASLRPALFVMGAVTLCGLAVFKSASASATLSTFTEAAKDGGAVVELGGKDGGSVIELGGKDGGSVIELGGKDGGSVELAEGLTKHAKDGGSISADKGDAGK